MRPLSPLRYQSEGVIREGEADQLVAAFREALDAGHHTNQSITYNYRPPFEVDWSPYRNVPWTQETKTGTPCVRSTSSIVMRNTVPGRWSCH